MESAQAIGCYSAAPLAWLPPVGIVMRLFRINIQGTCQFHCRLALVPRGRGKLGSSCG
jgi:hypothetical protein